MILALALTAAAHVPHDLVVAAAGESGGPIYAIARPAESSLLVRSDDDGRTWTLIGGDPTADRLLDIAIYQGSPVILGERFVWYQVGGVWASVAVPGQIAHIEAEGDRLWAGGSDGLFTGPPDQLVRVLDEDVLALAADADRVVVRTADDGLFLGDDAFSPIELPADAHLGPLLLDGTVVWAGDASGAMWRWDAGWTRFTGPVESADHPEIRAIAAQDGVLAVANADGMLFTTSDLVEWTDLDAPVRTTWGGEGGVSTPDEALTVLVAIDHQWLVGGWAGLAYGDQRGWRAGALLLPEYTRGVAFSPSFGIDGTMLWGTYAGGVLRTDDGGASFRSGSPGLDAPNVQDVQIEPVPGTSVHYAIVAHHLRRSITGTEWVLVETPFSYDASMFPSTGTGELWVVGFTGLEATIAATTDGGRTWDLEPTIAIALQGDVPRRVAQHGGLVCVGSEAGRLACSSDHGATFDLRFHGVPEMTSPVWIGDRIVLADGTGVHYSDDDGLTWTDVSIGDVDPPEELIAAGDTLWLATASARLLRSYDHGETWDDVGVQFPANVYNLVARPDYDAHPDLVVGTPAGLFRVSDGEDVVMEPFGGVERVECGASDFSVCDRCAPNRADSRAALGAVAVVQPTAVLTVAVRGTTVRVIGDANGTAGVVTIDGGPPLDLQQDGFGELVVAEGLDDGIHRVTVAASAGDGILVDAIEGTTPRPALALDPPPGDGCATARGAGLWGALVALSATRRRAKR